MEKSPAILVGARLPQSIKSTLSKHIPNISKNAFRLIVQLAVNTLKDRPIADGALQKIQSQVGQVDHIEELFAAIYCLIRAFLWLPAQTIKADSLKDELKELKFNEECIADLTSVLYGPNRPTLDSALALNQPHLLKLTSLTWRLDIIISSSCVSRVLEPCLMFKVELSDGKSVTFRVPINKFHQLRHAVAVLLADMTALEKRSFFKT